MQDVITWREAWRRVAPPRSDADAEFLTRYTKFARPAIILAAVLPLVITTSRNSIGGIIVGVGSWLIFVLDFYVQTRRRAEYVKSRLGMFDLAIVIVTSPWYLLPGVHGGAVVAILRLARVLRLLVVVRGVKRLLERIGRAFVIAMCAVMLFSWMAYDAESGVNPEFASYGDSLWWGIVTITTVGYGDIVPITVAGRLVGVALMVVGLALLGVVAGSLASFLRLSPGQEAQDSDDADRLSEELGEPEDNRGAPKPAAHSGSAAQPPGVEPAMPEPILGGPHPDHPDQREAPARRHAAEPLPRGSSTGTDTSASEEAAAGEADLAALSREIVDLRDRIQELTRELRSRAPRDADGS